MLVLPDLITIFTANIVNEFAEDTLYSVSLYVSPSENATAPLLPVGVAATHDSASNVPAVLPIYLIKFLKYQNYHLIQLSSLHISLS